MDFITSPGLYVYRTLRRKLQLSLIEQFYKRAFTEHAEGGGVFRSLGWCEGRACAKSRAITKSAHGELVEPRSHIRRFILRQAQDERRGQLGRLCTDPGCEEARAELGAYFRFYDTARPRRPWTTGRPPRCSTGTQGPSITTTDWRIRRLTVLVQLRISDRGKIAAVLWQVQFPRRKHLVS